MHLKGLDLVLGFFTAVLLPNFSTGIESLGNFSSLGARSLYEGGEDRLDTPEWLQKGAKENQIAKYRGRRFLSFPPSSTFKLTMAFTLPVSGIGSSNSLTISDVITFNLPTTTVNLFGRRSDDDSHQRIDVYRQFEKFIGGFGFDGHSCTLRAICEVAELPFEHGVLGEIINTIFSLAAGPSHLHSNSVYDDYSAAEYYGANYGNCGEIYPACSSSVLDFISKTT